MNDESNVVAIDEKKTPTKVEVARVLSNAPELSTRSVTLGDRVIQIVDLKYDAYVLFMAQLQPLLEGMMKMIPGFNQFASFASPGTLSPAAVITYCGKSLPEMARIVCAQTDPDITVEEVKALGKTPFNLAALVLAQIDQNGIINDLKSFFLQLAPLLSPKKK